MFSEAEKREYRALRAPEELRQRVLTLAENAPPERQRSVRRRWMAPAMAACLALVLLTAALLPRADVRLTAGEPVSAAESGIALLSRAAEPLTVPVTVETGGPAALTASAGLLRDAVTGGEVRQIDGAAELLWELEAPEKTERYTLTVDCGGERAVLTLAFDAAEGRWTVGAAKE